MEIHTILSGNSLNFKINFVWFEPFCLDCMIKLLDLSRLLIILVSEHDNHYWNSNPATFTSRLAVTVKDLQYEYYINRCHCNAVLCHCLQLENLVYYNRLKHSKIVISDFHLAKLENGLIKDPCGTPEYLGESLLLPSTVPCYILLDNAALRFQACFMIFLPWCSSRGCWQTAVRSACGLLGHRRHHVHTVRSDKDGTWLKCSLSWCDLTPGNLHFFATTGCQATHRSTMKRMTMIMRTMTRTFFERSWRAIMSLTLRIGTTFLIQVIFKV